MVRTSFGLGSKKDGAEASFEKENALTAQLAACLVTSVVFLSLAMAAAWFWAMRSGKSGLIDATWSFAVGAACFAVQRSIYRPHRLNYRVHNLPRRASGKKGRIEGTTCGRRLSGRRR